MKRILVTGATGNVGREVVHYLSQQGSGTSVLVAVRNVAKASKTFSDYPNLEYRKFDYEDESTFSLAFKQVDVLFLLRPPHISEIKKIFGPLLHSVQMCGIKKIVFLSVQGAEKSSIIPHSKIERLILELGFDYVFVRPSYFMQNLTTTLRQEIQEYRTITLPSGSAKFNWIDIKNIGEAIAILASDFERYKNETYEITGTENRSFADVTSLMSKVLGIQIRFININPIRFYIQKRREGMVSGFALVMTILHYLPRFQPEPRISSSYQELTKKVPTILEDFIKREKAVLLSSCSVEGPHPG